MNAECVDLHEFSINTYSAATMNTFYRSAFFCYLLLLLFACDAPLSLSAGEAKMRALKEYQVLKDTSQIGLVHISQDSQNHWFVLYNKVQIPACIYLFKVENTKELNHAISLRHKQNAFVEKLVFEDVTNDGIVEMLVYLHYDYDLSFQGRELIIFKDPFDTLYHEIFTFTLEQVWEHIESFDSMYGVPKHRKRIENHATIDFFEGKILIKGTIDKRKHHFVEYEWDDFNEAFKKILDEDLHEEEDENNKGGVVAKVKGSKILLQINAHEHGCKAYLVEDAAGHVLHLPKEVHDALRCSRITSLSDNGRFLVYMDLKKDKLLMYDFEKNEKIVLMSGLKATEGVSEIVWYSGKGQLLMAFVVVDLDEYEQDTQIHFWAFDAKQKLWKERIYDRTVIYECDFDGYCAAQKEYDFRFSEAGNFLFRYKKTGNSLDDFAILKLEQ